MTTINGSPQLNKHQPIIDIKSSLNLFFSPNSRDIYISTSDINIPFMNVLSESKYLTKATNKKYTVNVCNHTFITTGWVQIRRGDESPSRKEQCTQCKFERILSQ